MRGAPEVRPKTAESEMKRDKKLQQTADESMRVLVDEDVRAALHDEQARLNVDETPRRRGVRMRAAIAAVCMAVIIAVVVPCAVLLPADDSGDEPHFGWTGESVVVAADIADVNALFEEYSIDPEYVRYVQHEKDATTGLPLNYSVSWEDEEGLRGCKIWIIVDLTETDAILEKDPDQEMVVNGMTVKYHIDEEYDAESGAYAFEGYADLEIEGYRVYIREYIRITLDDDDGMADLISTAFVKR